jgi:ElaB/YqjD/DUF883 family membrane-anchored ribosome-binding protein
MDSTSTPNVPNTPNPSRPREADVAAAAAHLKESWEQGREAVRDARQVARKTWHDLSRDAEQYAGDRPWTTVLGALGAGLALGFVTGLLVRRAVRA